MEEPTVVRLKPSIALRQYCQGRVPDCAPNTLGLSLLFECALNSLEPQFPLLENRLTAACRLVMRIQVDRAQQRLFLIPDLKQVLQK